MDAIRDEINRRIDPRYNGGMPDAADSELPGVKDVVNMLNAMQDKGVDMKTWGDANDALRMLTDNDVTLVADPYAVEMRREHMAERTEIGATSDRKLAEKLLDACEDVWAERVSENRIDFEKAARQSRTERESHIEDGAARPTQNEIKRNAARTLAGICEENEAFDAMDKFNQLARGYAYQSDTTRFDDSMRALSKDLYATHGDVNAELETSVVVATQNKENLYKLPNEEKNIAPIGGRTQEDEPEQMTIPGLDL